MSNKFYLGVAALIIIVIAVGSFMYWQWSEVQQLKEELAQDRKLLEGNDKPIAEDKPPVAREGFKMVQHGDHYHEVPMDAPDVWQEETHEPVAQDVPVYQSPVIYEGPLTFHKELLKTNPVKALRLQAEERGHPAAKWIPPFPPDDLEAQEFARNIYLSIYLDEKDPESEKAGRAMLEQLDIISNEYPYGARSSDLLRLIWVNTTLPVDIYSPEKRPYPSDYFKVHSSELK